MKNNSKRKQAHKEQTATKRIAGKQTKKQKSPLPPAAEVIQLEPTKARVGNVINKEWKAKVKGADGDKLRIALRDAWLGAETPHAAYIAVCEENGIDPMRWMERNSGMRQMNLGNVLRGKLKRGEAVTVRGKAITL